MIISIIILLYFFILLQVSFLAHFSPPGMIPNLIVAAAVLISIFERSESKLSIVSAVWGGFLLDIFSPTPIGFWIFILLGISLFLRVVLSHYVRIPFLQKI